MKWISCGAAVLFLQACSGPGSLPPSVSSPLQILPASPEKGTIFRFYQPNADSAYNRNWTHDLDFSGVSWDDNRCATLVSPSHVVMAAHFMRPVKSAVIFHDRAGQPVVRFIVASRTLGNVDVGVGKLNLPVPSDIRFYRFANAADAPPGTAVITTDQTRTASVHEIGMVNGPYVAFTYSEKLDAVYRRNLVVGDSGHPTFLLKNGQMLLLETHTFGGPGSGPFYGDPGIQAAVRNAMQEMGN